MRFDGKDGRIELDRYQRVCTPNLLQDDVSIEGHGFGMQCLYSSQFQQAELDEELEMRQVHPPGIGAHRRND